MAYNYNLDKLLSDLQKFRMYARIRGLWVNDLDVSSPPKPSASWRRCGQAYRSRYCALLGDVGRRPAALVCVDITRWDNGSGRLTVRCSNTDATPRTVYLTPVAMTHLDAIRPNNADGSAPVFGLSDASISRRVKAAARAGAPTHEIMAHGRWRSAGMVADYTRAAKWLA